MDIFDKNIFKTFKGDCFGIGLYEADDGHILFQVIVEDDDNWFESHNSGGDVFWLEDLGIQIYAAKKWVKEECVRGEHGFRLP